MKMICIVLFLIYEYDSSWFLLVTFGSKRGTRNGFSILLAVIHFLIFHPFFLFTCYTFYFMKF